ncbi:MAG: bifunctional nuclease domain-containing protein [Spirochaetales bacterium]
MSRVFAKMSSVSYLKVMLIEAEIWTVARTDKGNAVIVKPVDSDRAVPIIIGQLEAQSILVALSRTQMPRPLTHDLFLNVFEHIGVKVERVEIYELREGTFYSHLMLVHNEERYTIDARPSDALGVAARIGCDVYIEESLVEEAGIAASLVAEAEGDPDEVEEEPEAADETELELSRLEQELNKAIEEENYEEAARIRDRIKELS